MDSSQVLADGAACAGDRFLLCECVKVRGFVGQSKPDGLVFECFLEVLSPIKDTVDCDDVLRNIECDGDPASEPEYPYAWADIVSQRTSRGKSAEAFALPHDGSGVAGCSFPRGGGSNLDEERLKLVLGLPRIDDPVHYFAT
jgi:hypothetical protein